MIEKGLAYIACMTYIYCMDDKELFPSRKWCSSKENYDSGEQDSSSSLSDLVCNSEVIPTFERNSRFKCCKDSSIDDCNITKNHNVIIKCNKYNDSCSSSSDCDDIFNIVSIINRDCMSKMDYEVNNEFDIFKKAIKDVLLKCNNDMQNSVLLCINNHVMIALEHAQKMHDNINNSMIELLQSKVNDINLIQGNLLNTVQNDINNYVDNLLAIADAENLQAAIKDPNTGIQVSMQQFMNKIFSGLSPLVRSSLDAAADLALLLLEEETKALNKNINSVFSDIATCITDAFNKSPKNEQELINTWIKKIIKRIENRICCIISSSNKEIIMSIKSAFKKCRD
ncbi:hypothetical protein H311_02574 [Anncaliia algerae PRA109]|nr:hypothetical protein H311_02574 [Anncaliia algerae PRA109]